MPSVTSVGRIITVAMVLGTCALVIMLLEERRKLYDELVVHEVGDPSSKGRGKAAAHSGYQDVRSRLVAGLVTLPWEETSHQGSKARKKSIIAPGEVPNLVGFSYANIPPGEGVEKHMHETKTEVFYVHSGQGTVHVWNHPRHIDDEPKRMQFALAAGNTVVIYPKEPHEFVNTGATPLNMFYFGVVSA